MYDVTSDIKIEFMRSLDSFFMDFEMDVILPRAEQLLRIMRPEYYDKDNNVIEEYYDHHAEEVCTIRNELTEEILGSIYKVYNNSAEGMKRTLYGE